MKAFIKYDPDISECKFMTSTIVLRVNKFTEDSAKEFTANMNAAIKSPQPVIPVVIDSYGGEVDSLISMITDIENAGKPVATIVAGKAMSCGAILFGSGTPGYRYIGPHGRLMIHQVSSGTSGKVSEMSAKTDESKRLNEYVYKLLSKKCKQSSSYFKDEMSSRDNADWFLTPKDALDHGLADHLKVPTLVKHVKVEFEWE